MGIDQHGCCTNETEIPSKTEEDQGHEEVGERDAGNGDTARACQQHESDCHHPDRTDPGNDVTGDERRGKHGKDMGRDDIGGVACGEATPHDRERRRGHDQVHQRIGHHGTDHGHDDVGVLQQLAIGASPAADRDRTRVHRDVEKDEQQRPHHIQPDDDEEGPEEGDGELVVRCLDELGANDGGQQAAGHHVGDGFRPECLAGRIRCRETQKPVCCHVDAGQIGCEQEKRKGGLFKRDHADDAAAKPAEIAAEESKPATESVHHGTEPGCRGHRPEDHT